MAYEVGGTAVAFSYYNSAFMYFSKKYIELCIEISKTMSIKNIRKRISAFMYEFRYALPNVTSWETYKARLNDLNIRFNNDTEFNYILDREDLSFKNQVKALPIFYKFFLEYLKILGDYTTDMSATYMPRTRMQENLLKFKNDIYFYEKLHEFKSLVFSSLSSFQISEFRQNTNLFITFFYAYKIFINEIFTKKIETTLGLVISIFINDESIVLLEKYPDFNSQEARRISEIELILQEGLLYCNSLVNLSFSSYGIIPKIQHKVYSDRTLI